jgi:hypothetical protein
MESLTRFITQRTSFNFLGVIIRRQDLTATVNTVLP